MWLFLAGLRPGAQRSRRPDLQGSLEARCDTAKVKWEKRGERGHCEENTLGSLSYIQVLKRRSVSLLFKQPSENP